jgi:minor extracellular serine protease Vpr
MRARVYPGSGTLRGPVRRTLVLIALVSALAGSVSASASLTPLRRHLGDVTIPRLRRGTISVPPGHADGTVRVIVTLGLAPLAQRFGGGLTFGLGSRKLDLAGRTSQTYLAAIAAAQRTAITELRRAIPQARVSWRYRILLDGFTVSLPATKLQRLLELGFVNHVYPSLRYTESLNRSRAVIGATQLEAATGADGSGIKIGVVDDGIDQTNPFFNPTGFSYPPGFPKGNTAYTTPKVIVARAFPGPGSGTAGTLPLDRQVSFHGTHVAGIAAGDANTTAPAGRNHPLVTGLSGVAPRAWLGNYRVFNVPLPFGGGDSAETPEIVAAFESAVADGMDVINFSGGGPETDPANDAMIDTIRSVADAGVVPVIAAGNDRDDFGLGTVQTPGSAPDAITVAAVSNSHFFGRELTVVSPPLQGSSSFPIIPTQDGIPGSWADTPQTVVDVGRLTGADGKPVERHLCGPSSNPNLLKATLKPGALTGKIALVERGTCSFDSKAYRAVSAGAIGMIVSDNRAGDPNPIPLALGFPLAMISDLDGQGLVAATASTGGVAQITIGRDLLEIQTDRSGVMTSFSSAGPTDFGHLLKPDISAPGAQILSSTLPEFAGSPFTVLDGTSMAAPHIAGSAALLLQRHPSWTVKQVKSALMTTAVPAYSNTSRTTEAPVLVEGAGLAWLPSADNPLVFTDPQSLSLGELSVTDGAQSKQMLLTVSDAGGGDGTWQVEIDPQSATTGASLEVQPLVLLAPGGTASLSVTARASADAVAGDEYGFIVLRRGSDARRVPYDFTVARPGLAAATPIALKTVQSGDTRKGQNLASVYRWPAAPFGPPPSYIGPPMDENGKEHLYVTTLSRKAVNFGVAVESESAGSLIEPWLLSAPDESTVQGYAGTPVNVNGIMFDYLGDIGAAGAVFASPGRYYFAVDSRRDPYTGKSLAGSYVLRSWVNDLTPPRVSLLTTRVAAGRPTIALHVTDSQSGVDPYSVVFGYGNQLVGASAYDPTTGTIIVPLPSLASQLNAGHPRVVLLASDYQESKNVSTIGANALPNTTIKSATLTVVNGPAITWITPQAGACAAKTQRLNVLASDTSTISAVTFYDGSTKVATVKAGGADIYGANWKTGRLARGRHALRAVVTDRAGHKAVANRGVRVC